MLIRNGVAFLLAILLGTTGSTVARAHELEDRAAIETEAYRHLERKDFSALEALADTYRSTKARTASGRWKLTFFYSGISHVFDPHVREDSYWTEAERTARSWVELYPTSPTSHLFYAQVLRNRAWSFRGGGYADTVKSKDWRHDHIEMARAYLEANKAIASQDPRWYELMTEIAYTQSWPEPEFVGMLTEGLERQPTYYDLYYAAVDYYSPKWGGGAAAIESFARRMVERTKQTEGWAMYARIYWHASTEHYEDRVFSESNIDSSDMKRGMDDVLRQYPDGWNVANFVWFACLKGDGAKTKELIERMDDTASWLVWQDHREFEKCKALGNAN